MDDENLKADKMQELFCFVYGEPSSRHDPNWLEAFGLFSLGWQCGEAFQQQRVPDKCFRCGATEPLTQISACQACAVSVVRTFG